MSQVSASGDNGVWGSSFTLQANQLSLAEKKNLVEFFPSAPTERAGVQLGSKITWLHAALLLLHSSKA